MNSHRDRPGFKVLYRWLAALAFICAVSVASAASTSTLYVAMPNRVATVDPAKVTIAQEHFIVPLIFEQLFSTDRDGNLDPVLVESWEPIESQHVLRMRLRKGHFFSDGTSLTAADVVAAFRRMCRPTMRTRDYLTGLVGCGVEGAEAAITVLDPKSETIEMRISTHPSAFLLRLAESPISISKILPDGSVLGSGVYQVVRMTGGEPELALNPYNPFVHTHPKLSPHIQFRYVPDGLIGDVLRRREVDMATMYLSSTANGIESPGYERIAHLPYVTQALILNPLQPPFDNQALRTALQTELYIHTRVHECAPSSVPAYGFIPLGIGGSLANEIHQLSSPISSTDIPRPGGAARELIIYRHTDRGNACEEQRIISAFAKFEISARFVHLSSYDQLMPKYQDDHTSAYVELSVFPSRDAAIVLRHFLPGTRERFYFYTKAAYEEQLKSALEQPSLRARFSIYRAINRDIMQDASVLPLYYVGHTIFVKKCLERSRLNELSYNPNSFLFLLDIHKPEQCLEAQ